MLKTRREREIFVIFTIKITDIDRVLHDYGISTSCSSFTELERYHYEEDNPDSKEVRLIVRADLQNGQSLVLRFKNEDDAPQEIIEAQSRFAALLSDHGVETPEVYSSHGIYARRYIINGYDVVVTVENFVTGEIKLVDTETAWMTGELLGEMHNISEKENCHVQSEVLFDPLKRNELFSFETFAEYKEKLEEIDWQLFINIVEEHTRLVGHLMPFVNEPRYAVQGDVSDCNLYRTLSGKIGIFDYNRCGDNILYFDAVMQAVFEARLMDYPDELSENREMEILSSFLKGYHRIRPFTAEQKDAFPYFYALITAFWLSDINWYKKHLINGSESVGDAAVHEWMNQIYRRELYRLPMPL